MVIKSVDYVIIVTDISLRSVETAYSISQSAKKFTNYRKIGVIINRVKGDIAKITDKLKEHNLTVITLIPEDEILTKFDLEGKPIIDIPDKSTSYHIIKDNIHRILEQC
jgi:CO dehydrogenase maturation factor